MKTRILFIITILVIFIGYVGCSIDSSYNTPAYEYSRCFTVIDSQTKEPVKGALLRVGYKKNTDSPFGSGGSREGITDGDGSVCFTFPSGASCAKWSVFGNQYKPICISHANEFPDVIEMEFECYFQFEIKNEAPFSEADNIEITYSDILECGSYNFISLNGATIDTTIIRRADPKSPSKIEVESTGANPFSESHSRIVNSRDTIVISVVY